MAAPLPDAVAFAPQVAGLIAWEDRGTFEVSFPTKSTRSLPSVYTSVDVCDQTNLIKGQISATVNQLDNCELVQAGNVSISISVPFPGSTAANTATNVDAIIALVTAQLRTAMADAAAA